MPEPQPRRDPPMWIFTAAFVRLAMCYLIGLASMKFVETGERGWVAAALFALLARGWAGEYLLVRRVDDA